MANNNHFELTLDTIAPTGAISRGNDRYHKENFDLTITIGDASYMKVWRNTSATGSKDDTDYPTDWETAATTKTTNFSTSVENYYHLVLMDSVGNESGVYDTALITFDNVAPVVTANTLYMADEDSGLRTFTNSAKVFYGFKFTDDLAGVVEYTVTGDVTEFSSTDIPTTGEVVNRELTLTGADGTKTINVVLTDAAGNTSVAASANIILDTQLDKPVLALYPTLAKAQASEDVYADTDYINFHGIALSLTAAYESTGIEYKIWEDGTTEPTEWTAYTDAEKVQIGEEYYFRHVMEVTLSDNDGLKTMHAKVRDAAQTVVAADDKKITIDTGKPSASFTRSGAEWISNVTGHTSSELTFTIADTINVTGVDPAGIYSYTITCNGSTIASGSEAKTAEKITITSATTGMKEGSNTFTLTVADNATNAAGEHTNITTVTDVVVKLDTTAPTPVSIGTLNTWYNAQFAITANTSDGDGVGVAYIEAYTSTTANDEACPSSATRVTRTADAQTIPASDITWALAQSAANYMHIKVTDKVGNVSYAHAQFGYDNVAPYDNGSKFNKAYYNVVSAQVDLAYSDATSGVAYYKVTGTDIDNPSTDWEAIADTRAVTLNGEDGVKTISVIFKDNAGNESTSVAIQTELDRSKPAASIVLKNAGTDDDKDNPSNVATFDAWIAYSDDSIVTETMQYLYYGPGIGVDESAAEWKNFVATEGKKIGTLAAMVLPTSTAIAPDGDKIVYVKFKDAAGNVSDAATAQFELDTTPPEPEAADVDFNRVSKVHTKRLGAQSEKSGSQNMCDEIYFTLVPNCIMQAFKVCAYANQAAAEAGTYEDAAIPETAGSSNMSGSGLSQSTNVSCMIKGADYETALGGAGESGHAADGLHYVVVYVQDLGGNWSRAAEFTA